MTRINITYGQPLEKEIWFSRASRIWNIVAITWTAPISKDWWVESPWDMYLQSKRCLEIIKDIVEKAWWSLKDIIRTRIFVVDMNRWKEVAKAHWEYFSDIQPACTFVEVSRFINPEWLVEIEADAVLD